MLCSCNLASNMGDSSTFGYKLVYAPLWSERQWHSTCRSGAYRVSILDSMNPKASKDYPVGSPALALTCIFAVMRAVDPGQLKTIRNRPRALKIRRSWLSRLSGNFLSPFSPPQQAFRGFLRTLAFVLGAAVSLVAVVRFAVQQRSVPRPLTQPPGPSLVRVFDAASGALKPVQSRVAEFHDSGTVLEATVCSAGAWQMSLAC
jgi:hypothetical protein